MLSRRRFLWGSIAGCAWCGASHVAAFPGDEEGAEENLPDSPEQSDYLPTGGCELLPGTGESFLDAQQDSFSNAFDAYATGNSELDTYLGHALVRATQFFNINPAFGFYEKMNAQASPEVSQKFPGTWGVVLFGKPLFDDELRNQDTSGMTIVAIIAHEFGHIIQYQRQLKERILYQQSTVKRLELHADILAGYYIGSLKRSDDSLPVYGAGEVFDRIGDNDFNNPNHHGTGQERVGASQLGFDYGHRGTATIDQVIDIGINYVSNI